MTELDQLGLEVRYFLSISFLTVYTLWLIESLKNSFVLTSCCLFVCLFSHSFFCILISGDIFVLFLHYISLSIRHSFISSYILMRKLQAVFNMSYNFFLFYVFAIYIFCFILFSLVFLTIHSLAIVIIGYLARVNSVFDCIYCFLLKG